jgi:hypothetical protein
MAIRIQDRTVETKEGSEQDKTAEAKEGSEQDKTVETKEGSERMERKKERNLGRGKGGIYGWH